MPQQMYCDKCPSRTFYLMLQDDGSIDAYCSHNNHKRTLVNIPELVEHVLKTESEDSIEKYITETERIVRETRADFEGKATSDDTVDQHGTPTCTSGAD